MKILLVDDDDFLRDMYVTKFKAEGDDVMSVGEMSDALNELSKGGYDAVLMDMVMPEMTGIDLIKKVRKLEAPANQVKCIVLSNQSDQDEIAAAKDAGADGYIIKAELIPSEVVEKVHKMIK